MADIIFPGMRGSVGLGADGSLKRRPENWREMILSLYPNGQAPLTALTSLMGSEKTDDPIFHWFEKEMPAQRAVITTLSGASIGGAALGAATALTAGTTVLYLSIAAGEIGNFKLGHVVHIVAPASSDQTKNRISILVDAKTGAGISGKVIGATASSLAGASYTTAVVGGSAYPEGDTLGSAIAYDPSDYSNYTQIFRNSLENTRTASKTRLRTGDAIAQAKKEALELHSIEIERAFIWNPAKMVTTGGNGQPLRVTGGLYSFITTNKIDFRAASAIGGATTFCVDAACAIKTYDWLMIQLEQIFRYGSQEKLALCGAGVVMAIQKMLTMLPSTNVQITSGSSSYGFKVQSLITPFGTLHLKTHPLFTIEAAFRNDMIILDTKNLKYRYIDDTSYKPDRGANDLDGSKSEFLTEAGLEVNFEKSHAILNGFGLLTAS